LLTPVKRRLAQHLWKNAGVESLEDHRMTAALTTTAFLSMLAAASVALAQPASAPARAPGTAAPPAQADDQTATEHARSRADADARACLEFVTNIGVIRCAEKYRAAHAADADRGGMRQSVKGSAG
jgi:hypothetical protein